MLVSFLKFEVEQYMLPCLNKKLFGLDCMGCGMQRSVALIFRGNFIEAFYMYPAIYSLAALFICIILQTFLNVKHLTKPINILAIISVATIIVSFIIKLIF